MLPGRYRLTLLFGNRPSTGTGHHPFDVTVHIPGRDQPLTEKFVPDRAAFSKAFDVQLSEPGVVQVVLTPADGKLQISGLVLEPLRE